MLCLQHFRRYQKVLMSYSQFELFPALYFAFPISFVLERMMQIGDQHFHYQSIELFALVYGNQ